MCDTVALWPCENLKMEHVAEFRARKEEGIQEREEF